MVEPIVVHFSISRLKGHNCWWEFTEAPPEGVTYVFPRPGEVGYVGDGDTASALDVPPAPRWKTEAYDPFVRRALGGVGLAHRWRTLRGDVQKYDLYHSVGSVHPLDEPWIVGCESTVDFFHFQPDWRSEMDRPSTRAYVSRKLLSRHCKRLLPWSEAARQSILRTFPDHAKELDEKTEILPLALRAGAEPAPYPRHATPRMLFVGSRNYPQDFVPKGGHMVLAAFAELRKRMDVELYVRAKLPEKYERMYAGTPGLHILSHDMSFAELSRLYDDCNVFVFPGSSTPGMAIREAMRAARPVVTTDVWMNAELIEDGVTGVIVPPPHGVEYANKWGALNWSREPWFIDPFERNVSRSVDAIADACERILRDPALGERMGKAARREIMEGRFSIGVRNKRLRRIYEEAIR